MLFFQANTALRWLNGASKPLKIMPLLLSPPPIHLYLSISGTGFSRRWNYVPTTYFRSTLTHLSLHMLVCTVLLSCVPYRKNISVVIVKTTVDVRNFFSETVFNFTVVVLNLWIKQLFWYLNEGRKELKSDAMCSRKIVKVTYVRNATERTCVVRCEYYGINIGSCLP